ncbi:MAG: hypothetical protein DHS20C18_18020 [Saprospiraceae bacterium]|nr:MAG: hypothetical protein DHS20C18_18020 [Saprospiraceae bacterium]
MACSSLLGQDPLEVTNAPPITPENLITNIFLGDGVEVLNVTYEGDGASVGFFKNGEDEIGIDRGIVMSTGRVVTQGGQVGVDAIGNAFASSQMTNTATDVDLTAIADPDAINDVTKYTITFIPISDTLRFRYVFGSEEYPEFTCSNYNDIFGFFISGPGINGPFENNGENIALVPGSTNLPVTINNINSGMVGANGMLSNCTPPNGSLAFAQYYNGNNGSNSLPVYDGFTTVLTAQAIVVPCSTYTIKLAISDVFDSAYDSGVFLEAKSFGTGSLKVEANTVSLDGSIAEGCAEGAITFSLPRPTESDYIIDYNIFGTAENGVDYSFIPPDLFIPAGDSVLVIPIIAFEDGITEGTETLILDVQRDVCNRDTFYLYIKDNPLIPADLGPDTSICQGESVQLHGMLDVPLPDPPTFSNTTPLEVSTHNVPFFSDIQVGGVIPVTLGPDVIKAVCIDSFEHRWIDDIDIYLIGPDGQFLELTTDNGADGGNLLAPDYYLNTCFTVDATTPINAPGPFAPPSAVPFTGNFLPEGVWSDLWDGDYRTNGTWRLQIFDDTYNVNGTLFSWTICFNPLYQIEYSWEPAIGLSCTDCPNPIATPDTTTTYTMTAVDSYGCETQDEITITVTPAIDAPNVSCGTTTTGSIIFVWDAIPGSTGYEVNVDGTGWVTANGNLSHEVTGLSFSQQVTIEVRGLADCPGFTTTLTCETLACTPAGVDSQVTSVACNGGQDGTVQLTVTSGTGPFLFELDGLTNDSGLFTGLPAGTHVAIVTDGDGCPGPVSFEIAEPAPMDYVPTIIDPVSCNGGADATATVVINGGSGPFSFAWDQGGADSVATGLGGGTQLLSITDANGCVAQASVDVPEPEALDAITGSVAVTCGGAGDGQAFATVTGGTEPYLYSWNNQASDPDADTIGALAGGTYTLDITDANGCLFNTTVDVLENPPLSLMTDFNDTFCFGSAQGSASVEASGGTEIFSYQWYVIATGDLLGDQSNINSLEAGDYAVAVADGNGCMDTAFVTIGEPMEITVSMVVDSASCNGNSDGSASLSAVGGNPNYSFTWTNDGITAPDRNDLAAGDYTVVVSDQNGCSTDVVVTIGAPEVMVIDLTPTMVSCFGGADGTVTVLVDGGTEPYQYQWSDGQDTPTATDLTAGMISLTVIDANNCAVTESIDVGSFPALSLDISGEDPTCFEAGNGNAIVAAQGGAGNYQYDWTSGSTDPDADNLGAGSHEVVVTDGNGCTEQISIELFDPEQLIASTVAGSVSCNGAPDGTASVSGSGGTGNYTYTWSDPNQQTVPTAVNLAPGTYFVTITDENGCTAIDTTLVASADAVVLSLTYANVNCFGGNDGMVSVLAEGGTGVYTYEWDVAGLPDGPVQNNLTAGTYNVTVTDTNNCTSIGQANLSQPDAISSTAQIQEIKCFGDSDGSILATVSGGVSPYTYLWNSGQVEDNIANLTAGTYILSVTDSHNCSTSFDYVVEEASVMRNSFSTDDVLCYGESTGTAIANVSGGRPPYAYVWSNNMFVPDLRNITAGTYQLKIIDSNGCELMESVEIKQPDAALAATVSTEDITCFGGRDGLISMQSSGGTPSYRYSLDNHNFYGSSQLIGLEAGTYNVFVKDANGCTFFSSGVVVEEPGPIVLDVGIDNTIPYGGTMRFYPEVSGGFGNLMYEWFPQDTSILECLDCPSPLITVDHQTSFRLRVTDENGCYDEDVATVFISKFNPVMVPTGFSPNGDGTNDLLLVHGLEGKVLQFRVFDRWGEMLYENGDFDINDPSTGWNGNFREEAMQPGVYIWQVEVEFLDGNRELFKGQTTLIR